MELSMRQLVAEQNKKKSLELIKKVSIFAMRAEVMPRIEHIKKCTIDWPSEALITLHEQFDYQKLITSCLESNDDETVITFANIFAQCAENTQNTDRKMQLFAAARDEFKKIYLAKKPIIYNKISAKNFLIQLYKKFPKLVESDSASHLKHRNIF